MKERITCTVHYKYFLASCFRSKHTNYRNAHACNVSFEIIKLFLMNFYWPVFKFL